MFEFFATMVSTAVIVVFALWLYRAVSSFSEAEARQPQRKSRRLHAHPHLQQGFVRPMAGTGRHRYITARSKVAGRAVTMRQRPGNGSREPLRKPWGW